MEEDEEGVDLKNCDSCKFYSTDEYEIEGITYERSFGACRRYPPRRIDGANSAFPIVEDDWWCGEFVPNDK